MRGHTLLQLLPFKNDDRRKFGHTRDGYSSIWRQSDNVIVTSCSYFHKIINFQKVLILTGGIPPSTIQRTQKKPNYKGLTISAKKLRKQAKGVFILKQIYWFRNILLHLAAKREEGKGYILRSKKLLKITKTAWAGSLKKYLTFLPPPNIINITLKKRNNIFQTAL